MLLRVVLYGCQTQSLILKEEDTITVFESRKLRGTFRPKKKEIIEG